ncbi:MULTISPECIES: hypothetical protein, partial [unclassified Microcoleus]|uniref:hypothetical protein n=1 Tax=unclassified Microcoleus TaxID=2642155 RepID=UPI002FCF9ADC
PVPQNIETLVEQASCLFNFSVLATGKMPVPQNIETLVEQASCLFNFSVLATGEMPVPQNIENLVEQISCLLWRINPAKNITLFPCEKLYQLPLQLADR